MKSSHLAAALLCTALAASSSRAMASPPANDTPGEAVVVPYASLPFTDQRDVSEATPDPTGRAGCYGEFGEVPQKSVWYTFTAPSNASVEIDTLGSNYDTSLSVTSSCGGGCTSFEACADDSGGKQSQATLDAKAGTPYLIMVELQKGAVCPAGGCQLVLNVRPAREHTVELRFNASAPDCYVGASLRTSRTFASDSDFKSGIGGATAVATGVGTDFYFNGYSFEFCETYTRPLVGSLWVDGVRVARVENSLQRSRQITFYGNEIQDQGSEAASIDDPDLPTGSLAATMVTKTRPGCRARAGVYAWRTGANDDSDSWSNVKTRKKTARATVPVDVGDRVEFVFGGSECRDGAKITGVPTVDGRSMGAGWLKLRSATVEITGEVPPVGP